ncbi:MAG: hypothetical protein EOP01_09190, partial [Propionibacteriaceae bacterium]
MKRPSIALGLLLGLLTACSAPPEGSTSAPAPSVSSAPSASSPPAPSPTATPTPAPEPTKAAPKQKEKKKKKKKADPVSMQALIDERYDGHDLRRGRLLRDQGS